MSRAFRLGRLWQARGANPDAAPPGGRQEKERIILPWNML
jgi:hypothetical protein